MGCDWYFWVQVRQGHGRWITTLRGDTKTRCGGGPIITALKRYAQAGPREETRVRYGQPADEAWVEWDDDEEEEENSQEQWDRQKAHCGAFLSIVQFAEFLQCLQQEEEERRASEEHECNVLLYTRTLRPFFMAAQMSAFCVPPVSSTTPWMGQEALQGFGPELSVARRRRLEIHTQYLCAVIPEKVIPSSILVLVAEYSLPAFDVRILMFEDEDTISHLVRPYLRNEKSDLGLREDAAVALLLRRLLQGF